MTVKISLLKEEGNMPITLERVFKDINLYIQREVKWGLWETTCRHYNIGYYNCRFLKLGIMPDLEVGEAQTHAIMLNALSELDIGISLLINSINNSQEYNTIVFRRKPIIEIIQGGSLALSTRVILLNGKYTREALEDAGVMYD